MLLWPGFLTTALLRTLREKPLPIAPSPSKEDVYKQLESRNTVDLAQIFIEKMSNEEAFESAFIHVENIKCPILLVSGAEDKMWPSSTYSDLIMKRLEKFNSPIFRQHLCYEKAGHMITNPYDSVMTEPFKHPFTGLLYEIGGNQKHKQKLVEILGKKFFNSLLVGVRKKNHLWNKFNFLSK